MLYNLHFFSSKYRLFHNSTLFGFCITHILNTGCAKICKKIRRQKVNVAAGCTYSYCLTLNGCQSIRKGSDMYYLLYCFQCELYPSSGIPYIPQLSQTDTVWEMWSSFGNTRRWLKSRKQVTLILNELERFYTSKCWGTRWRSWLRHCATSRKVAGSIPDGVIGIFLWHNPSSRTMALRSTQPLTEMSTRNISWEVKAAGA